MIYHVKSQNHVIEGLCKFLTGSSSCMVYHHLAKFGGHRYCGYMFLVCHVI